MSTFIGSDSIATGGGNAASVTLPAVQVGDLIVVAAGVFSNRTNTWAAACADNLGNVYVPDLVVYDPFAVAQFYSYATVAGAPVVTVTQNNADTQGMDVIAANYRDAGVLDQHAYSIGQYIPGGASSGTITGGFSLCDTLVISFAYEQNATLTLSSDDGDTLRTSVRNFCLFEGMNTGPGNRQVKIRSTGGGEPIAAVFTFSKPLPRPVGLVSQYALRPGIGFQDELPAFGVKRPINVSLPYLPAIGSVLIVGSVENGIATKSPVVTDNYGNTYTLQVRSVGQSVACLFTATVDFLPPAGEMFQVTFSGAVATIFNTYQNTAIAITEHTVNGPLGALQTAAYNSVAIAGQDSTIISDAIANIPTGAYLFAIAGFGGTVTQDSVAWSALEGYAIQQHWDIFQAPAQTTNRSRIAAAAIMDKVASADGSYDAQVVATLTGNAGAGTDVSIALLSLVLPMTIACPVNSGSAIAGLPFVSAAPVVTGGTPPDTFALSSGPAWLSIDPDTGIVSGTPDNTGEVTYVIEATDSMGNVASTDPGCTIIVRPPIRITRPLSILTAKQWSELREKSLLGMPTDIYLDHEFPNAGFHLWPIPSLAHQIEFFYWAVLPQFATPDAAVQLPEGYYDSLVYALAVALCQSYRRPVPQKLLALAANAKKSLQEMNAQALSGSYHSSRTLSGPNEGEIKPHALDPVEPNLLPGATEK